jgi:lysophospholipase L1-like esterase
MSMSMLRHVPMLAVLVLTSSACGSQSSPTDPSPTSGPPANAAVYYTAIGASDAAGVGSSVPCVPFTDCPNGTGYVPVLARQLQTSRQVTVMNLGIPASVLGPAMETLARQQGREVTGNFVDRQMPFVPAASTLVTIFGGGNDVNAVADAIGNGAAGGSIQGYIDTQARAFGADYDRLVQGVRSRATAAFIIVMNVPNLGAMPYAARYPSSHRAVLQAVSVAFSLEANRQARGGVVVLDLMCDPAMYNPAHFAGDGFHPNDAGYAHLASRLAAIVNGGSSTPAASCSQMQIAGAL